jgi:ATP-dependent Lon protease
MFYVYVKIKIIFLACLSETTMFHLFIKTTSITNEIHFIYYNNHIIYIHLMKKNEYKIKPDNPQEVGCIIEKKILFFKDVIQRTFINAQNNQYKDILSVVDVITCNERLTELNNSLQNLTTDDQNKDEVVNKLQLINNDLSSILKNYGTMNLEDLLVICFGNNLVESDHSKFDLLKKYFHPISYKIVAKNEEFKHKKQSDDAYDETTIKHLDCFDIITTYKQFHVKVYGMKLYVHSSVLSKSLFIFGIVDDIALEFLGNSYIENKQKQVYSIMSPEVKGETFERFMSSLNLKDYLTIGSSHIINKYNDYITRSNTIHQKQISFIIKDFMTEDLYKKRTTLMQLLIMPTRIDNQYLSYMLYDLLSNDVNGVVDSRDQTMLYESFTHKTKVFFKQSMKKTLNYTNSLYTFDINKIPLEQQICLMNAPDSVKEKGMMKLKEVKNKSEDSGAKARQYLDGLLKIPFGVFRREPMLDIMSVIKKQFRDYCDSKNIFTKFPDIPNKTTYTTMEIYKYVKYIQKSNMTSNESLQDLHEQILQGDKQSLVDNITIMNEILISNNLSEHKIKLSSNKTNLKSGVNSFFKLCKFTPTISEELLTLLLHDNKNICLEDSTISPSIVTIQNNIDKVVDYTKFIRKTLDSSVYGHDKPKKQLEMIMAEWMSSGNEGNGYVIGFEGNPGVGKTSLAKGISNCLVGEDGKTRPFKILMMGGDANAASLVGHSFTYVGSNWGLIVQYLQDSGCMNPVIVIDEPDKISKTEHGKEITGILTHLLDKTQNHLFQDKYFAGVDLDLSKVLFILCYNDPNSIDRVLLDRIHRVKFDSLTTDDKIVIVKKHLLPDILKNIGLENMITFSDATIKIIINDYTQEPGVRKLKEKMFEIVGAINLNILQNPSNEIQLPFEVTIDDVKKLYFKDKREVVPFKIHTESKVGLINALWANDLSQGGVLPLQVSFIPAAEFLSLTLTGSLGDVMKESIRVSLTNAWNLTSKSRQQYLIDTYNNPKTNSVCGLHLHCPSISQKKDGPSATTAFTILIYSLFNDIKIKNTFGITGETSFDYILSEIGGLEFKIIHSIPSGVTEFIFPKENKRDFEKIMDKFKDKDIIKGIKFHCVETIDEVLELILDK